MKYLRLLAAAACALILFMVPGSVDASINPQISFQGKLTNSDGTNVTDGNYSVRFRIYTDPSADTGTCANTCKWEETQGTVAVAGGLFHVNLGSVTTLPGSVDFNGGTLYLGVKVSTDAEMTPRVRLTASPYAFNSDLLDGLDSAAFVQLSPGSQQTGNINVSGTITSGLVNSQTISSTANFTGTLTVAGASSLTLGTASTSRGAAIFKNSAGTNTVTLQAPATNPGSSFSLTLPTGLGSSGDCLKQNDGTGTLAFGSCATVNTTLQDAYNNSTSPATITTTAGGKGVKIVAGAVPTTHLLSIDNAGQAVTTADVNGLDVNYVGGNAAVQAAGVKIDFTPGGTSGGTWSGLRIVANATGAVSGVNQYGLKLEGPTSQGAGTEVGLLIDGNWDAGIQMATESADPAAPPTDNIYVFARKISGRSLLRQKAPSGVSFAYQPALFEQSITYQGPNTGATVTAFGSSWTVDTTASHPAASETFGFSTNFATAATAADTTGVAEAAVQHFRGSTAGSNGFFYVARLGLPDANYGSGATGARIWTGLTSGTAASMVNADNPAGDYVGFQYSTNRGDTAWQFITKDNTTQSTPTATLAIAQNKVYDFYIYTPPQGTTIYWRIDNLTDGTTQEGSTTTNLPRTTIGMRAGSLLETLTTTARNLRVMKHYVESDR